MQGDGLGAESYTDVLSSFPCEIPPVQTERRRQQCRALVTTCAFIVLLGKSSAYSTTQAPRQLPRSGSGRNSHHQFWMNMPQPSTMFIETTGTKSSPILSPLFAPSPPQSNRFLTLGNHHIPQQRRTKHRGVLGFHVNPDNTDGDKATTATRLGAQKESSSVAANLDTWNLARPLQLDSPFLFPFDSDFYKDALPAPQLSPERIAALTVVQLKVELGKRGLKKTGNKADLQQRLLLDTAEQQAQDNDSSLADLQRAYGTLSANSLAEWSRTVDLEPLMRRRETIHREKLQGKKQHQKKQNGVDTSSIPADYRSVLKKVFDQSSSPYSNLEVKQMYKAAKIADQMGDPELCMRILLELKRATPHDARLYRRLSRLEKERGNTRAARAFLHEGLELQPDNAFLWSGLGQLEGSMGDIQKQKECLRKAIELDPSIPNSHHALGTLEHTGGEIAKAMKILKRGIDYCPKNHRLHHALGDLYRDAKMLDMAEKSYRKAILYGPAVSHGFAYTALSYVAYEQDKVRTCRHWLHRAVESGRNANGWVALAQMEESEGNIDAARDACVTAITQYERRLLKRARTFSQPAGPSDDNSNDTKAEDPIALKNKILQRVPSYRSGDRFFNVYRNWMRLEERHGSMEAFAEVYERASAAFPKHWKLSIDAAQYFARQGFSERARRCFSEACGRAESRHADPFRLFAAYEMSRGNHALARQILYMGALNLADNKESDFGNRRGLAELFYTWGVCEWQMNCLPQASSLFFHALEELASSGDSASKFRSFLLFVMARFEVSRLEYLRAQHFIGLCLKENTLPGGNAQVWGLWEKIALENGDERLALRCRQQATTVARETTSSMQVASSLQSPELKSLVRRDPWHHLLFGNTGGGADVEQQLYSTSFLPDEEEDVDAVEDDLASLDRSLR